MISLESFFSSVLDTSIIASYVAAGIIIIRVMLKNAPKIFSYTIWSILLVRLILPFSISTNFSFLGLLKNTVAEPIAIKQFAAMPKQSFVNTGVESINNTVSTSLPAAQNASVDPIQILLFIGAIIWIIGLSCFLIHSIVSYIKISNNVKTAFLIRDNIYQTDRIKVPFVFGIMNPKIYIPINLSTSEGEHIILHESTHIKRFDYIIKPFAYLVLILHWFNPIIWVAFILMSKDMEMSCDENVLKNIGAVIKAEYAKSLLSFAAKKNRLIKATPLTFGESSIKARIKNIVNYKKPKFWIIAACIIILITAGVVLISNPKNDELPIILDADSINGVEYFYSYEKVLEADKDDIQIKEFAELFNQSKRYTDDAGTTHPELIRVLMDDRSIIDIWWGTQGFITVGDETIQFNMQNSELEEYMSELVADIEKTAAKGLELYVWTNFEITGNDDIYYTLLQGTNRNKNHSEIYNLDMATTNLDDINKKLEQYRNDTEVSVILAAPADYSDPGKEVSEPIDMQTIMDIIKFPTEREGVQTLEPIEEAGNDIELENHINRLIATIMSSPMQASATSAYINEHQQEFDEIVNMGHKTLFCLVDILKSKDHGLRGNIVYQLCDEITQGLTANKDSLDDEQNAVLNDTLRAMNDWENYTVAPLLSDRDVANAREVVAEYFSAINAKDDEAIIAAIHPDSDIAIAYADEKSVLYGEEIVTLTSIYDFDSQDGMLKSFKARHIAINEENVVLFKVDFNVEISKDKMMQTSYEEGMYYGWNIILVRQDKNNPWLIYDQGY